MHNHDFLYVDSRTKYESGMKISAQSVQYKEHFYLLKIDAVARISHKHEIHHMKNESGFDIPSKHFDGASLARKTGVKAAKVGHFRARTRRRI